MKEQYRWNYTIKIKTKDGTYEYEKESLDNIDLLLEKHKDYEELKAEKVPSGSFAMRPRPPVIAISASVTARPPSDRS